MISSRIEKKGNRELKMRLSRRCHDGLKRTFWTLIDREIREERGALPKQVKDYKAMMEENGCGRYRIGQVSEQLRSLEGGDWKRLKRTDFSQRLEW